MCSQDYVQHVFFFFQAEDGIRDLVRSRGLGDVYKRQALATSTTSERGAVPAIMDDVDVPVMRVAADGDDLSLIHI